MTGGRPFHRVEVLGAKEFIKEFVWAYGVCNEFADTW